MENKPETKPNTADTKKTGTVPPGTTVEPTGVIAEPAVLDAVDTTHPAVDDNPRKNVPEHSNRIDFNDPTLSGVEAVEQNLKAQG